MLGTNGVVSKRTLGTMAFDSGTYDNYVGWIILDTSLSEYIMHAIKWFQYENKYSN